jgi:hypothetical protein
MANTMKTGDAASKARDTAGTAKDAAMERASGVAGEARSEVGEVARDAREHASELTRQSKDQLRRQAMEQTERLSGSLRQASDQLRAMGQGRGAPSGVVSDLTNQLADVTGGMAGRLESGGLDGAIADVKRFARNRPAVFLAAAAGPSTPAPSSTPRRNRCRTAERRRSPVRRRVASCPLRVAPPPPIPRRRP